MRAAVNWFGEQ